MTQGQDKMMSPWGKLNWGQYDILSTVISSTDILTTNQLAYKHITNLSLSVQINLVYHTMLYT